MAVKEDHDLAHDLLLGPGGGDAAGPHWTDPIHLVKATGFGFDHIEHLLAKDPHQLLGVDRADPSAKRNLMPLRETSPDVGSPGGVV